MFSLLYECIIKLISSICAIFSCCLIGAYGVQSKSHNPTVLGQDDLSSTQYSNPSWACRWHHPFGTNNYPAFRHSTKNLKGNFWANSR